MFSLMITSSAEHLRWRRKLNRRFSVTLPPKKEAYNIMYAMLLHQEDISDLQIIGRAIEFGYNTIALKLLSDNLELYSKYPEILGSAMQICNINIIKYLLNTKIYNNDTVNQMFAVVCGECKDAEVLINLLVEINVR